MNHRPLKWKTWSYTKKKFHWFSSGRQWHNYLFQLYTMYECSWDRREPRKKKRGNLRENHDKTDVVHGTRSLKTNAIFNICSVCQKIVCCVFNGLSIFLILFLFHGVEQSTELVHTECDDIITITKNNNPFKMIFRSGKYENYFLLWIFNKLIHPAFTQKNNFSRKLMNRIWNSQNRTNSEIPKQRRGKTNDGIMTVSINQITHILITLNSFKRGFVC